MVDSPKALLDEAFGEPEERPTIADSVAGRLRELILTGKLPPGTPLRLSQVAARMGVSVMPIREAIRILESERLVTIEPRRGAVVATLSIEDIEELYAVRAALEALAAKHGARNIGPEATQAMRAEFEAMVAAAGSATPPPSWPTTASSTRVCTPPRGGRSSSAGSTSCSRAVAGSWTHTSTAPGIR